MKTPLWFYELNCIKLLLYKWLPNWMKKKVVAPSNLSLVDLHLCQKKCIIFVSYICIVAFHLGTIEEPREWRDIGDEPEDDEWWTCLEDGRMDSDVHDQRKMLVEQLFSN